jgi:hypothetical protein
VQLTRFSKSGLINPRVCLAFLLCSIGALLGIASFAVPTPPRGTLLAKDMIPAKAALASVTIPPYETPVYTPPPDDSIALGSLLEASGYSGAATGLSKSIAAGNFCGDAQKEIFVVTNSFKAAGKPPHSMGVTSAFSLLQGPTPNFLSNPAPNVGGDMVGQWQAAAAANLDPSQPYDQIVLIRPNTKGQSPNLVVLKVFSTGGPLNQNQCAGSSLLATAMVGDIHSALAGAAIGNFDRTGKKRIAMLDSTHSSIALVEMNKIEGNPPSFTLNVVFTQALDGNLARPSEWNALVAGDIDHDGVDELIAARHISDNRRPTVVAFKWNGSKFVPFATSTFGNNGNSEWAGAAAGDFNADGRYAIVLVKNKHSNFAVLDLPPNAPDLQVRTTADLDSVEGQSWVSLAATDWLSGDQGAAELIAFRGVTRPYRTNFFVYGNPFHRVSRDTGLDGTKAQWIQHLLPGYSYFTPDVNDLKAWISGTHTNVFNWFLGVNVDPPDGAFFVHDYAGLVKFLSETKNWTVDGKQLRVWVTLGRPKAAQKPDAPRESCSLPEDTRPLTSWNALDYFAGDFSHDYDHLSDDDKIAACRDMVAWAAVIGRLAQDFPHLVAVGIDDFSDSLDSQSSPDCVNEFHSRMQFSEDCIAVIESRLRSQAPWLNFVPTVYYGYFQKRFSDENWADLGLTLDSIQFFFRNEKNGECIDHSLGCERSVNNAPDEIRDMHQLLPGGRKLQVGMYFVGCQACSTNAASGDKFTPPQVRYDYDLARIALDMPIVGGATAYGLQTPPWICNANEPCRPCTGSECALDRCTEFNFLDDTSPPGDADPNFYTMWGSDRYCALQKAYGGKPQVVTHADLTGTGPAVASKPSAYFDPTDGTHHVIYRSGNGHLHELWWTSGAPGQGDLTPYGPAAVGDPAAYFVAADQTHHVIYRSSDGHLHELVWTGPNPAARRDLTPNGPLAVGSPAAYFDPVEGTHHVIYRSGDGHLHEIWWGSVPLGQGDLTPQGPSAADDPSAYFVAVDNTHHVFYRSSDGHLRELVWTGPNPAARRDLTPNGSHAVGSPSAYFLAWEGTQHLIYRSGDAHLYEIWSGPGSLGSGDITPPEVGSPAESNPSSYSVAFDGTSHVVYRSHDGHIHELLWTKGAVTHNDLTGLVDAPQAVGNPAAYYFAEEGAHHVFYQSGDGHLNELRWSN